MLYDFQKVADLLPATECFFDAISGSCKLFELYTKGKVYRLNDFREDVFIQLNEQKIQMKCRVCGKDVVLYNMRFLEACYDAIDLSKNIAVLFFVDLLSGIIDPVEMQEGMIVLRRAVDTVLTVIIAEECVNSQLQFLWEDRLFTEVVSVTEEVRFIDGRRIPPVKVLMYSSQRFV